MKEPAQNVIARLPQLLRLFDIRVALGSFNVEGLGEGEDAKGSWEFDVPELFCPEFPEDKPPEPESPDLNADVRLGGDVNPTRKKLSII